MQVEIVTKPLALRNLQRVDFDQSKAINTVDNWNWVPSVSNPDKLFSLIASGGNTTSRQTQVSQTDHGENW